MVTIREIIERALLIDDANGGFLCTDANTFDVVRRLSHLFEFVVYDMRGLNRSLCMEFSSVGDLEEYIFHDIGTVRNLEFEGFSLEVHVGQLYRKCLQHDLP